MLLYNNHNYNTHTIQESAFAISLFSYKLMRPFHHGFLQKFQIYEHLFLLPIGLFLCPGYLGVLKAPGFYVLSFLYWISLWQSKIFQMLSVQIYMLRTSNASHITSCFFLVCQFCSPDISFFRSFDHIRTLDTGFLWKQASREARTSGVRNDEIRNRVLRTFMLLDVVSSVVSTCLPRNKYDTQVIQILLL